jgi:hypothetical protein
VPIGTASKTAATDVAAITAPQNAEHAASATPFSLPAQPSHVPDIGISFDIGISLAVAVAGLKPMSGPAKPCVTRPTAKTKADSKADMRRGFPNSISHTSNWRMSLPRVRGSAIDQDPRILTLAIASLSHSHAFVRMGARCLAAAQTQQSRA